MKIQTTPLKKMTGSIQQLANEKAKMNEINQHRILVAVDDEEDMNTIKVNFEQQNYQQVEFYANN